MFLPAPLNTSVHSETAVEKHSVPHVLLRSPLNARNALHVSRKSKDQRFLCCTRARGTLGSYCSCTGNWAEGRASCSMMQGPNRVFTVKLLCVWFGTWEIANTSRWYLFGFRASVLPALGCSQQIDDLRGETCFHFAGKLLNSHF